MITAPVVPVATSNSKHMRLKKKPKTTTKTRELTYILHFFPKELWMKFYEFTSKWRIWPQSKSGYSLTQEIVNYNKKYSFTFKTLQMRQLQLLLIFQFDTCHNCTDHKTNTHVSCTGRYCHRVPPQPVHVKCQHFNRSHTTKKDLSSISLTLITGHNLLLTWWKTFMAAPQDSYISNWSWHSPHFTGITGILSSCYTNLFGSVNPVAPKQCKEI